MGSQFFFYLRADQFEKEVTYTPETLLNTLQKMGASWAFLSITIGVLARQLNKHCSSQAEMEMTQSAYIQALAWGDIIRAQKLGDHLRMGTVSRGLSTDYQAEVFETVSNFRWEVESIAVANPRWQSSELP